MSTEKTEKTITLTLTLKVTAKPGTDLNSFVDDLDYCVTSNTTEVVIKDTELEWAF